jgi:hypothetical protein
MLAMDLGSRALVAGLCTLTVMSCHRTPRDRLQGRWIGAEADAFAPAEARRANGWASGASFEFRGSRVIVTIPAESPREGAFEIAHVSGEELRVRFVRPHGTHDEATLVFEGRDRLRWKLDAERSILLRKVD